MQIEKVDTFYTFHDFSLHGIRVFVNCLLDTNDRVFEILYRIVHCRFFGVLSRIDEDLLRLISIELDNLIEILEHLIRLLFVGFGFSGLKQFIGEFFECGKVVMHFCLVTFHFVVD